MKSISDFNTQENIASLIDILGMDSKDRTITVGRNFFYSLQDGLQLKVSSSPAVYERRELCITSQVDESFNINDLVPSIEARAYATDNIYRINIEDQSDLAKVNQAIKDLSDLLNLLFYTSEFEELLNALSIDKSRLRAIDFSKTSTTIMVDIEENGGLSRLTISLSNKSKFLSAIYYNTEYNSYMLDSDIGEFLNTDVDSLTQAIDAVSSFFDCDLVA